jgi:hypothetical protein
MNSDSSVTADSVDAVPAKINGDIADENGGIADENGDIADENGDIADEIGVDAEFDVSPGMSAYAADGGDDGGDYGGDDGGGYDGDDGDVGGRPSASTAEDLSEAEIRERAKRLAEEMTPEQRAGFRDLLELARCIGMPAARALLMSAAPYGTVLPAAEVATRITAATPFDCEGSIQFDFVDVRTGLTVSANLYAAGCGRMHDLGAEIAALRAAVPPDRWTEVSKHFSNLVLYVRTQLASAATEHAAALTECGGAIAEVVRASAAGRLVVQVDSGNFTMFLHPDWARVGIYVGGATPGTRFA